MGRGNADDRGPLGVKHARAPSKRKKCRTPFHCARTRSWKLRQGCRRLVLRAVRGSAQQNEPLGLLASTDGEGGFVTRIKYWNEDGGVPSNNSSGHFQAGTGAWTRVAALPWAWNNSANLARSVVTLLSNWRGCYSVFGYEKTSRCHAPCSGT